MRNYPSPGSRFASLLVSGSLLLAAPAGAAPVLIGTGTIPGTATDSSGLTNLLEDGVTPGNLVGGLGSAITYTGKGTLYHMTPDRGPADGATTYKDRVYLVDIPVTSQGFAPASPAVIGTTLLANQAGQNFIGSSAAFDPNALNDPLKTLRFDPEGVRRGKTGTVFVSDEYGPYIYEFDKNGKLIRSIKVPDKFLIQNPSATGANELPSPPAPAPGNTSGRQANRGMEGLAITPDGSKLFGIMQSPLIQDGALNDSNQRRGINTRILELDLKTGNTKEYLYQLSNRSNGVNEILTINDHEFLVIERDGNPGSEAAFKQIFRIDITGATDISNITLPQTGTPDGLTPVSKGATAFIDLLDPAFGLAGPNFPEKIEGLAFGPDLEDGRHLLLVTSDNDFFQNQASTFYAFAIDRGDLPNLQQQVFVPLPASFLLLALGMVAAAAPGLGRRLKVKACMRDARPAGTTS